MKSRIFLLISSAALACSIVIPAGATSEPLGLDALQTYNLIVLGNLNSSSEVEGRTFVGGNLTGNSSNYQIDTLPASSFTGPGLTVVGNVTGGTKNLNNGSGAYIGGNVSSGFNLNGPVQTVEVGGTIANTNVNQNTVTANLDTSNPAFDKGLQQYGSAMSTSMIGLSSDLSKQPANSTLTISNGTGTFNAVTNSSGDAVFNVTTAQLSSLNAIQFNTNGANTVIVNVTGTAATLNANFLGGTNNLGQSVIWNFANASSLTFNTAWGGSVLAPLATAQTNNYIQGSAVFGSLSQNGEFHIGTYDGDYIDPVTSPSGGSSTPSGGTSVPEPGMVGLFGLGALALLLRRRQRRHAATIQSMPGET